MKRHKLVKGLILMLTIGTLGFSAVAFTGMSLAEPTKSDLTGNKPEKIFVLSEYDKKINSIIKTKIEEKVAKIELDKQTSENINEKTNSSQNDTQPVVEKKEVIENQVTQPVTQNLPAGEDGNMIRLINETRAANGLGQLTYDPTLYSVADIRLNEISTYFSHTRPDGSEFYTVSSAVDGENLSKYGAGDATSSFNGFMNSQGHRENILYSGFNRVACKKAVIGGVVYWIQLFGY